MEYKHSIQSTLGPGAVSFHHTFCNMKLACRWLGLSLLTATLISSVTASRRRYRQPQQPQQKPPYYLRSPQKVYNVQPRSDMTLADYFGISTTPATPKEDEEIDCVI